MNQDLPTFSTQSTSIKMNGVYRHYKNKLYKILYLARHSETHEELVVYQALYGDENVWVRPISLFLENLNIDGKNIPRFTLVSM